MMKLNGTYSIDKFIDEALYNKKFGYYSQSKPFGKEGDFTTAPLITPIFIYFLLNYISGVNLLEERAKEKWGNNPEYVEYLKTTPKFFPKIF